MAYLITSADGNITIQDEERDTVTSLVLVGRHFSNWGESYAQNFVNLLTNFASDVAGRPTDARRGQLWYDVNDKSMYLFRGVDGWYRIGSSADTLTTPRAIALTGDVIGSALFDGSRDIAIETTLPTKLSGTPGSMINAPGQYSSPEITVDEQGRIIGITNNGGDGTGDVPTQFVLSFNARGGAVTLTRQDVINALGFDPYPASNPNNFAPSSTPQDLSAFLLLDGSRAMNGALNMNGREIIQIGAPQAPASAVRKADLDNLASLKTLRKFQGANDLEYNVTVSTAAPSGGVDGDVWYRY